MRKATICILPLLAMPAVAVGQTEMISAPIGGDSQFVFPHTSLPGAVGIDFSFTGAFSPTYPAMESHTVVIVFEWGPTALGPWTPSSDFVNTVPGGITDFYATGVFPGPADAPFVAIHFYAGAFMFASGGFGHISVIPTPGAATLMLGGVAVATRRRRPR